MQILFSTEDVLGDKSGVVVNYNNHLNRKTNTYAWGTDKHTDKLFPRGKAYARVFNLQLDSFLSKP